MRRILTATAIALSLSACAGGYAGKDYTPVVDVQATAHNKRIPEMEMHRAYKADLEYCQGLASQRSVMTAGGQSGAVGAAVGAGTGALAGVVAGGRAGMGALLGAGAGALGSLTYGAIQGNQAKQDIVMNCLRERGYSVLAR